MASWLAKSHLAANDRAAALAVLQEAITRLDAVGNLNLNLDNLTPDNLKPANGIAAHLNDLRAQAAALAMQH